jgi:predicted NBD/HSP70 family sugar kinase
MLKDLNERTVLETIRADAPISRAQISRRAGISKPTVSVALRSLLQASLVREVDHDPGGRRYGAVFFEPVAEAALVLGLDVGARFLRGALCDLRGEIRARQDVEIDGADVGEVSGTIVDLKASLVEASGLDGRALDCAVLGVPGAVDDDSRVHLAPRVRGLEGRQLGRELTERLGVPVTLENDINLAALGERWHGVARGVDDFVFLSVGTGLGAGLVLRGELHRGRHGAAGEVDLVHRGEDENVDPSADAIAALAARMARDTELRTSLTAPYRSPDIFAAARGGDPLGRAVVDEEARRIALHIVPIAAVVDVALVVLGGGVGVNADLLLAPVRTALERWLPYPPQVEVSTLGEAAVLSGALSVGLSAALDNVFVNRARDVGSRAPGSRDDGRGRPPLRG